MFASIGLALFVIVILSSLVVVYKRLRYESWYFVHLMVYLAVLFAFWHQIELGGTLLSKDVFYAYWVALYVIVFGGHIVFRFARPVYLFWKHKFFVEKIVRETPSTVSVYISGNKIDKFNIHSGQFMIFRFLTKRMWWQAHPFSLSMMPDGKRLRITVKELGDFTREVKDLEPGTKILIDGPYGVFTDIFSFSSKVLFIAGGIGITPIRSLAEEMLRKGKQVTLLYANRTESDITFRRELEDLTKHYPLQLVHVLSDDPDFAGEKGWVDEEKLQRLVPDLAEREVYLCGPVPMMLGLLSIFKKLKLKKPLIHYERFSLHV